MRKGSSASAGRSLGAAGFPSAAGLVPALALEGLTKSFGSRKAVDCVSFDLPQGAFLSVFGPNGAGKTTLLRMLATLARPSAGSICVNGIDAKENPELVRASMGFVSHNPMLYPDLTAEENLVFAGRLYGVENPEARALELLDAVGLKTRRLDRVRTFSRGMTQRVSIARALVNDPSVLLLDEPYAGLDSRAAEVLDGLIASMRADRTFVMVSHSFEKGQALADHVLFMAQGRALRFAPVGEFAPGELRELYRRTVGCGVA